ncbi:helix-turn-helix domain-containing protein [Mobiluncus mulieris]|uniref:helix-turn-helix domain-containing protein n=1 Tax=Mobiluncus mulieris TaxID=2052 RepID=UPI0014704342|nr:helix-turn-helix domain-containing protein [Mobiluncus mulieris]NMX11411.1 helix-turn-helix domain-containing protein [Mobiluncus mulieris]
MGRHKPITEAATKDALAILGGQVRTARTNQQWSRAQLAALAGCSPRTIASLETGSPTVSIGTAIEVMRLLGIPLFGTDDPVSLARLKASTERYVALLPARVHAKTKLDNDF